MKYHRGLMMAILHDRVRIANAVNACVIGLDDAPQGYAEFDSGQFTKFALDRTTESRSRRRSPYEPPTPATVGVGGFVCVPDGLVR